jgi:thiol-disulfide isomerase/thioredoxin
VLERVLLATALGALMTAQAGAQTLVREVRAAVAKKDFAQGEALIGKYQASKGVTAEMVEGLSWMGRGALAENQTDRAERYAVRTHEQSLELLKGRRLDDDNSLPIALGAAIEVEAQVLGARGARSEAVAFLQGELKTYFNTSIRTRIQKNINLLSLEGRRAPALEVSQWLGPKPAPLGELRGKPVLLFFWAHWCPDCKWQAPILARLKSEYGPKGLVMVAPTQPYGYTARGQNATPEEELKYIEQVRLKSYADLADVTAPVSEENFRSYGASTVPTLVLIDRQGVVRMYHPGQMPYEELAPRVAAAFQ